MRDETKEMIISLAESLALSLGLEILELRFVSHNQRQEIRITLDNMSGPVTISNCSGFSRKLSRILDVEDPVETPYVLNVSSPGFRRPIRIPKDLPRFVNHRVRVKTTEPVNDQKVWTGKLCNEKDPLIIQTDEKGDLKIAFNNIERINLHE